MLNIESAHAWKVSEEWGHLSYNDGYDYDEIAADEYVTGIISYDCTTMYGDYNGWVNVDNYWSGTTATNVYNYLASCNNPTLGVTFATNWWTGDFNYQYINGDLHYGLAGEGGSIMDPQLYNYATSSGTTYSRQFFNFIWTCVNGGIEWDTNGNHNDVDGLIGSSPYTSLIARTNICT